MTDLVVSTLPKTWIFDLDGVLVEHNGHRRGDDRVLPGVKEFFAALPLEDVVIILTARTEADAGATRRRLQDEGLRYNHLIFGCPVGERVLLNDRKPSGLATALAINLRRDQGLTGLSIQTDPAL
ncbi:MAG TPA: hypothetical protein VFE31_04555 [Opitutaceae bacterium]|jgi:hypothetical protein|nr:hypothetical protein [Opitutaceae bacterium]